MCARTFCPNCGEEMIHRDNRKPYESASAFGQIVHRCLPRTFTVGDVDLYYLKRSLGLLRAVEHKQPSQTLRVSQLEALGLFGEAIEALRTVKGLHSDSGLYVIRGEVGPATTKRAETTFLGPQSVCRWPNLDEPITVLYDMDDLKKWMHA